MSNSLTHDMIGAAQSHQLMNSTFRLIVACLVVFHYLPVAAAKLKGQAVTYADFNFVNYIAASENYVYFATTEGITRYNKFQDKWEDPLTGVDGIDSRDIKRIWVDSFDKMLIAETSGGLFEYDSLFYKWLPISELPDFDNSSVHIQPPRIMFPPIGFDYTGEGQITDYYGRYFALNDIVDDRTGTLWIGTWGYGSARAGITSGMIDLLPFGLLQDRVNALVKLDDLLWMGGAIFDSYRSGLSVFDLKNNNFFYIESGLDSDFPAVDVNCLDGNDTGIFIGTPVGLLCLDKETKRITQRFSSRSGLSDDNVISVKVIGDSIFVGTAAGLSVVIAAEDSVRLVWPGQFLNDVIYDLEQVDSSLWIAASSGAYRLKLPSGRLQKFRDPDLVLFNGVYDIESYESDLWFASEGGVVRLNIRTGETEPFRLINQKIVPRALAVNDTIAALASDKGMMVIFFKNKNQFTREFTTDDGLASNYVYSLLIDGDYIWIGTDKGLTRFLWNNPERVD